MFTCRKMKVDPYLLPYTKLKSKWIKDLNKIPVTLNLKKQKIETGFKHFITGDCFLNIASVALTL